MERVDANLIPFAKNNTSGYRFAFGTDTETDDINANYNDNIKKGWGTTPNEFPEVEDFNAMAYTSSYLTAYLYQMGISEWNNKQNYKKYSRVIGSDGKIYKAKKGTDLSPNVNNNPVADTTNTNWEDVLGNFVTLTGNQTIAGIKTFSSSIVGNITGNAGTATNASNLGGKEPSYYQQALGFTPIQQGGGASQSTNKIFIGWQGPYLRCQVDGTDFGTTFPMNITGNSSTAVSLSTAVGSAPSYACRAWVNFNGAGTVAIRASGNVSSITDIGVGNYTVNFTTAMPDANYVAQISFGNSNNDHGFVHSLNTGNVTVVNGVANAVAPVDPLYALVLIIR